MPKLYMDSRSVLVKLLESCESFSRNLGFLSETCETVSEKRGGGENFGRLLNPHRVRIVSKAR